MLYAMQPCRLPAWHYAIHASMDRNSMERSPSPHLHPQVSIFKHGIFKNLVTIMGVIISLAVMLVRSVTVAFGPLGRLCSVSILRTTM